MKKRLDILLVERKFFPSRNKAQNAISDGQIYVQGEQVTRAATLVENDASIEIKGSNFVSRGGKKLAKALQDFKIDPGSFVILDGGASTGGFTQCLLRNGARRVYAVDVGHGQLAEELRNDPRVVVREGVNLRHISEDFLPERVDLAVLDLSFISLCLIIHRVVMFLKKNGLLLALVKPQYEIGPGKVNRRGLVKDPQQQKLAIKKVWECARNADLGFLGLMESPITGTEGNKEFFLLTKKSGKNILTCDILEEIFAR